jgi:N6-L-threonylcarbamoyladenine synthase
LEGVAATYGPGLAGSLLVGLSMAKGMAVSLGIPFAGVNHLEGHLWANFVTHQDLDPPMVVLIVSGGHTQLVHVLERGKYRVLGRTRDDAAGEAFDKVGKLLKLGFPGGPVIEKTARQGDPKAVSFPRAYLEEGSLDFSFSGIKTAVLNHVSVLGEEEVRSRLPDIAASFQEAVVDVLVRKTIDAASRARVRTIGLSGGVALNDRLKQAMRERADARRLRVVFPQAALCADNAGMIAAAGHHYLSTGKPSPITLSPVPSLNL